jgi:Uma2 family endonuclease
MTAAIGELWARAARGELTTDDLPNDIPGVRLELINGSLIVTPLGDFEHQAILTRLCIRLEPCLPQGLTVVAGVNVIRGLNTVLIPDVAVVDPQHLVQGGLGVAPEGLALAIEVSSPSTRVHDLTTKRELYRQWDVPYLIVDRVTAPPTLRVEIDLPEWAGILLD